MSEKLPVVTPEILPEIKLPRAFDSWDAMVSNFKEAQETARRKSLKMYWDLGGQVELIKRKSPYGGKGVVELAAALGCKESTLYDAASVYMFLDRDRLDAYMKKAYVFSVVLQLSKLKDPKLLAQMEEKIDNKEIPQKELHTEVRKLNDASSDKSSGKKKDKTDPQTTKARIVKGFILNASTLGDKLGKKLLETEEAVDTYQDLEDADEGGGHRTKTEEMLTEGYGRLVSVHGRLAKAIFTIGRALNMDEAELAPYKPAPKAPKKK